MVHGVIFGLNMELILKRIQNIKCKHRPISTTKKFIYFPSYQQVDVRRNFALGPKPKITRQLLLRRQLDGAAVKSEELIVK